MLSGHVAQQRILKLVHVDVSFARTLTSGHLALLTAGKSRQTDPRSDRKVRQAGDGRRETGDGMGLSAAGLRPRPASRTTPCGILGTSKGALPEIKPRAPYTKPRCLR